MVVRRIANHLEPSRNNNIWPPGSIETITETVESWENWLNTCRVYLNYYSDQTISLMCRDLDTLRLWNGSIVDLLMWRVFVESLAMYHE